MSSLLERVSGEDAVQAVVNAFYDKVFSDEDLKPFFAQTDHDKQRFRQSKFLIQLMDGKASNAEEYMRSAHKKYVDEMDLSDREFDIVAGHLVSTLNDFKVPEDLIGEIGGALESLRDPVLNR